MTTKNIRYQKIRNLILNNAQHGLDRCVIILNENGFIAPCGRRRFWKKHQVQSILSGEMYAVENVSVGATITKAQKAAILKSGKRISDFVREALKAKLYKEGLL